ncbi:MAG: tyrosine-type recombinase/integrase [Alphaproteobacteria bacterium]|nr:tyrosine-type recombinase/integrase [Alphaproteobacteria bacterium]
MLILDVDIPSRWVSLPSPDAPDFLTKYNLAKRGRQPVPPKQSFSSLIASYKRSHRFENLASRTRQDYDKCLLFMDKKIGNYDPTKMQRRHIIQMQMDNAEKVRWANYLVQVARVLFEHAIDLGWIERNPAKGVSMLKSKKPPRRPWPVDLIEAYRNTAEARALLIFELCLGTGQRIGDVRKMRWADIEGNGINVHQGKTGVDLWLPFTPQLAAVLDRTPHDGLFIISQPDSRPVSYRAAAFAVMKVRKEIGAEEYDIHALRHTTASELAALGLSDELIMAVTGHTSRASVVRYAGAARQKARAQVAQDARNRTKTKREK